MKGEKSSLKKKWSRTIKLTRLSGERFLSAFNLNLRQIFVIRSPATDVKTSIAVDDESEIKQPL